MFNNTQLFSGIDFNPCGHPPFNVFNVPHYDMHFYTSPLEIREGWTCAPFPPAPVICDFTSEQTSASGRAFFNVSRLIDKRTYCISNYIHTF